MSPSNAVPFNPGAGNKPNNTVAIMDERSAHIGRARIKDVENKLDAIHALVQRLADNNRHRSRDLAVRRRRHRRDTRHTTEAIRHARHLSDADAIIRAGQQRFVERIGSRYASPLEEFTPVHDIQDFAAFVQYLPPELLQEIPWTPFVYSLRHMYMPQSVHRGISWLISDQGARNREYQELVHAYLHLTASRLADITPCYMDMWRSYIPAMAFGEDGNIALLEAIVALAALHIAPFQHDRDRGQQRAMGHYITALQHHRDPDNLLTRLDDSVLATALLFAHYEMWNGEIMKMGLHMLGSKQIILERGLQACQTPIGRALFAFFIRTDMQSSVVTGNPMFLDETWWKNDPLYHIHIPPDAPILLAADAGLVKLSVIVANLTFLKRSAAVRRKKLLAKLKNSTPHSLINTTPQFLRLEEQIRNQVQDMRKELEAWHRSLPKWFGSLHSDQMADGEEDINGPLVVEVRPQRYMHHSIASVLTCAFATNIQLWRVAYPEELNPPPFVGAVVHALLRAWLATPQTCDSVTMSNVWIAANLLRHPYHREWLEMAIKKRIKDTDYFGWKFAYHGILHQWALVDGKQEGRFKSVPQGAQEIVPGVSENLWRADGIMNTTLSDLTAEDQDVGSSEGTKPMYRFTGDSETKPFLSAELDSDGEDEGTSATKGATTEPETTESGKRIPLYSSFIDDY